MRREPQVSSQIFAEFGFALLHTRTKGVTRPVFAVCMPEENVAFKDPYFKQITVAFVMLVPDDELVKINNDIMGHISGMLIEEPEFMEVAEQGRQGADPHAAVQTSKTIFQEIHFRTVINDSPFCCYKTSFFFNFGTKGWCQIPLSLN